MFVIPALVLHFVYVFIHSIFIFLTNVMFTLFKKNLALYPHTYSDLCKVTVCNFQTSIITLAQFKKRDLINIKDRNERCVLTYFQFSSVWEFVSVLNPACVVWSCSCWNRNLCLFLTPWKAAFFKPFADTAAAAALDAETESGFFLFHPQCEIRVWEMLWTGAGKGFNMHDFFNQIWIIRIYFSRCWAAKK